MILNLNNIADIIEVDCDDNTVVSQAQVKVQPLRQLDSAFS